MTRLALFGGSFNPPHVGHVMDIAWILSCAQVDEVWITPTWQHAFGKSLVSFEDRLEMTRSAMSVFGDQVVISTIERELGRESRTIRVVDRLLDEDPSRQILLVVGSDILDELDDWLESERLLATVELIVLRRSGYNEDDPRVVGPLIPEISSTAIRDAVQRGELASLSSEVPRGVLDIIERKGLYREES